MNNIYDFDFIVVLSHKPGYSNRYVHAGDIRLIGHYHKDEAVTFDRIMIGGEDITKFMFFLEEEWDNGFMKFLEERAIEHCIGNPTVDLEESDYTMIQQ